MSKPSKVQLTFGRDLSMNGVDPEQNWVLANSDAAQDMFGNQGVQPAAMWIAALHPRALEYLEQAPVLALAASFGGNAASRQQRAYIAMNMKPLIDRGAKLKEIMKAFRVAYQLRAISATAIRPGVWKVLQAITAHVQPSQISQSIPKRKESHLHWLGSLSSIWETLDRRAPDQTKANGEFLSWAMLAMGRHELSGPAVPVDKVADFIVCNRDSWNRRWTWDRMINETLSWHEALANAEIDKFDSGEYDTEVDYGRYPREAEYCGYTFHALQSLRALVVEGKAMHHCVSSYHRDIVAGHARIYSIREDGKRVATLELRRSSKGIVVAAQLKGVCNSGVTAEVTEAAKWLASDTTKVLRQ